MAKGSQLSQLKAALHQAGLSRPQQNGKKRKRTAPDQRDKEKKAEKLKEINQKLNPFDVKVTKLKHDVGGRKIAGTTGRPAQSKQAGIEQRKKTLLKEYKEKHRAGGIVDRRFGENDPTMAPEDRMLERFTREHQRVSKGTAFNLEDEDELTHYGQSLSKLDDFDNVGLGLDKDEDDDGGQIDRQTVQKSHFGGFGEDDEEDDADDEPARKRSKAEVMQEVVAKSKLHKLQRQSQQEEDENIRHELDQELDSIRSLLYASDPSASTSKGAAEKASEPSPSTFGLDVPDQDQEYDQYVRELVFEKRAKPKDRTKTEEEMALEEKDALEKAERRRIRRMNGEPEESDDEEVGKRRKKGGRQRGGDDLEDDFYEEDGSVGLGAGLGEDEEAKSDVESSQEEEGEEGEGSAEEEEEGEEGEGSAEEEDEDDDDDESAVASDNSEDVEEGETEALVSTKRKRAQSQGTSKKELPFTFPCPSTHEEFLELVDGVDDKDVPIVVQRIRTLHHPSLAEDNKHKLQELTGVLIDHILYLTSPPTPRFSLLASLVPHLFALTKSYPIPSAQHFIAKLKLMHKNLKRGLSHGATAADAKTWPGLPELSLLRVIGQIWPTSDKHHHVVSPARLLMGAYLGLCRVRSLQDLSSGLFLSTLFLQYESLSKRFVPEAINFLANTVLHLAPHSFKNDSSIPGCFPCPDFCSEHCLSLAIDTRKAKKCTLNKPNLSDLLIGTAAVEQAKVDLLGLALDLLGRFGDMYKGLDGFIELYGPVSELLSGIKPEGLPEALVTRLTSLQDAVGRLLKFSRQARRPLMLQAHKPIPIPTYVPKFEHSSSNYLRNRDPDHERNEAAKLRRQYKEEKKGAIRELRKDARFLATEQQRQQKEKDKAYNDRMKRVLGSLESERAEEKSSEREKAREKKRSGRK